MDRNNHKNDDNDEYVTNLGIISEVSAENTGDICLVGDQFGHVDNLLIYGIW